MRNRQVYIRYLPPGTPIGDPSPNYLSVRNYPIPNALASLGSYATHRHLPHQTIADNHGLVVTLSPFSVYVAYPDSDVQTDVYSPDSGLAHSLALSGAITPITGALQALAPAGQA